MQLSVRGCRGRTTDGSRGERRVRSERDFVLKQLVEAASIHHQQHQISLLAADLQTYAAFRELHEYRIAPGLARPATHHSRSVFAADNERSLLHRWEHDDTFGALPEVFRNALVG